MTDRLGLDRVGRPVGRLHLDLAGCRDPADPDMGVDLVFPEQEIHALDVAVDALVLEFEHGGKIERGRSDLDAHSCRTHARPRRTARKRAASPSTECTRH